MKNNRLKVLLIIEQCNPDWASVPLEGYCYYEGINRLAEVTLVTHERNKSALDRRHRTDDIIYIYESRGIKFYYKIAERLSRIKGKIIWPLRNTLTYPVYSEFNRLVYSKFAESVMEGHYDIVHSITPMMPRYPVKIIKACKKTPFIIGPVNGGVPFPKGFPEIARQEFAYLNFFRSVGRVFIPGYRETYEKADCILAGSSYTLGLIKELFDIKYIHLFYENGISDSFLTRKEGIGQDKKTDRGKFHLLFVGRLVPYKGADMLIEALSKLKHEVRQKIVLTIVGDGSERNALEQQSDRLNLLETVKFKGWLEQKATIQYYRNADIFCFPSVREFGGAVVLEAMANALPCIVVNNGGIGEYVTEETGFKIDPHSREFVVQELTKYIEQLFQDRELLENMSIKSIERVQEFSWNTKAEKIINIYNEILEQGADIKPSA